MIVGDTVRYYDTCIEDLRIDEWINENVRVNEGCLSRSARTVVMVYYGEGKCELALIQLVPCVGISEAMGLNERCYNTWYNRYCHGRYGTLRKGGHVLNIDTGMRRLFFVILDATLRNK